MRKKHNLLAFFLSFESLKAKKVFWFISNTAGVYFVQTCWIYFWECSFKAFPAGLRSSGLGIVWETLRHN